MNVQLSETQEMLRTSAREFLADNCPPTLVRETRAKQEGYSPALWRSMVELGWLGLSLPEDHGGSGMSFLDLCLLHTELGRVCAPVPFAAATVVGLAISRYGSIEQRTRLLPRIASGDLLAVPGLQCRRDSHGVEQEPVAMAEAGGLTVSGGLDFVPWAGSAQAVLCPVAVGSSDGEQRLAVVPLKTSAVGLTPLHCIGPDRLWRLDLDSVHVEAGAILGDSGAEAIKYTRAILETSHCCDIAGALGRVLEETVTYAKDRTQFDRSIGSFQVIQHYCADMHVMLEGLRTAAFAAAWSLSQDSRGTREASILCAYAHRVVPHVLSLAHQVHGAMGVTQEHDLHLYTTRAVPPGQGLAPSTHFLETILTV